MKKRFGIAILLAAAALTASSGGEATVVPPCQGVLQAIRGQGEEAWFRRCAAAQVRHRGPAFNGEDFCRRWIAMCRRNPASAGPSGAIPY